ncbi:MAG: hypothetical protein GVY26_15540 [Bacteroidetes bacterium]|jgi:hypothetical protein|nr:hypothetical protein [Bacteroidota bacterium]
MKPTTLRYLNLLGFALVILMNTLANALPINGYTTGELSALYPNRFVPAGFTFSIWGVIYLALLGFVIFQFTDKGKAVAQAIGIWFFLSCVANASWILAWHYRFPVLSLIIMLSLLFTLVQIYRRIQPFDWGKHWAGRLPFQLYIAWITVATVANTTAVLVEAGWSGGSLSEITWAAIMAGVAAVASLLFLRFYKDLPYALVILWALFGIYSRQVAGNAISQPLGTVILVGGGLIVVSMLWAALQLRKA